MSEQFDYNDESNIKAQAQGLIDEGPLPKWSKGSTTQVQVEEISEIVAEPTIDELDEYDDVYLEDFLEQEMGLESSMINQLVKNEITQKPRKSLLSPYTNNGQAGESCALIYQGSVIFMWRALGADFMIVNFENNEIDNLYIHEDAEGTGLLALCLQNGDNLFVLWFPPEMEEELNEFIYFWDENYDDNSLEIEEELQTQGSSDPEMIPKTIVFGAILINLIADADGNLSEDELGVLETIISNPSLFLMCIEYCENNSFEDLLDEVSLRFDYKQRCMLIANMIDLVYRNGFEDVCAQEKVDRIINETSFPKSELDHMLRIFQYKNDVSILEKEIDSSEN